MSKLSLYIFTALYLAIGGVYFLRDFNHEFVIYVAVIIAIFGGVLATLRHTKFPTWMLWLLSFWGLLHVLGGAIETRDGVLFAYKIYPFIDLGGDFYILKYDQVVHGYLYGVVGVLAYHALRVPFGVTASALGVGLAAVLISVGISSLNEIMEFLIAVNLERNGVGGYENAMLDFIFNLSGAIIAVVLYAQIERRKKDTITLR